MLYSGVSFSAIHLKLHLPRNVSHVPKYEIVLDQPE